MPAGRRQELVAFWRKAVIRVPGGQQKESWAPIAAGNAGKAWAAVYWGKGEERREAGRLDVKQTASFEVLSNALTRGVTELDRIVAFGSYWDIAGPGVPVKRDRIEFVAHRGEAAA